MYDVFKLLFPTILATDIVTDAAHPPNTPRVTKEIMPDRNLCRGRHAHLLHRQGNHIPACPFRSPGRFARQFQHGPAQQA